MIYRSNLECPDLTPYFKLRSPACTVQGHDIPSDPDFGPDIGFLSHDEAAILYHCAQRMPGSWVDIGARVGWSTAHILMAGAVRVNAVEQDCKLGQRFYENIVRTGVRLDRLTLRGFPSQHELSQLPVFPFSYGGIVRDGDPLPDPRYAEGWRGFLVDGCHDAPAPLEDAQGCARIAQEDAVIVLHDFQGRPVRDAARWLMDNGWHCRVYWTANQMAVCWRGNFTPPDHVRDPAVFWPGIIGQMGDFDFSRCE